jgi:hypothetical protein
MSYDFSAGLSGAASGAAAGSTFGPVGTAIGGGVGLLSGFLGGDDENPALQRAISDNRQALGNLVDRRDAALEASPTETAFFNTGATQLQEQAEEEADTDAAQAAARGLSGSQFEVAQDQARAEATSKGLRQLVADSERMNRRRTARLDDEVQQQRSALSALVSDRAQADRAQQQRQNQALFSSFAQAAPVLAETNLSGLFDGSTSNAVEGLVGPPGSSSGSSSA